MNLARVEPIADAILYEGYLLYPYRATSLKNRQRWTFGVLYPRAYSEARGGLEPWSLQSECLVSGDSASEIEIALRFLHPISRTVRHLAVPSVDLPLAEDGIVIDSVHVDGRLLEPGQEAVPGRIDVGPIRLGDLERDGLRRPFVSGPWREREPVRDASGRVAAVVIREQHCLEGEMAVSAARVQDGAWKLTVQVRNLTAVASERPADREPAILRALASAHLVLGARDGAFVSLLDPPPSLREHAAGCRSVGAWPVMVGAPGQRDTMLCSPIILDDYPAVAPESPGDLFDGTEIDEILTLRILTLTDDERERMAAADDRVRALLERTEALDEGQLARLHGALRRVARPRSVVVAGTALGAGDRVRLHPAGRGDIFDLALAGRTATILSVEQDYEERLYFSVTIDDDPGKDLGAEAPGHRFFFGPEEVTPLHIERGGAVVAPPRPPARVADVKSAPLAALRVLVAGVGNVFLGDDAFGVEVVERLRLRRLPPGVTVVDFGIRGIDLAYALGEYEAAILIDTVSRGGAPGTLYVLEPDVEAGTAAVQMHSMTPETVLRWMPPGTAPRLLRIVGCEPATFGVEGAGREGLSEPVQAAVEEAVRVVQRLVEAMTGAAHHA